MNAGGEASGRPARRRLFLALWPDEDLRQRLGHVLGGVLDHVGPARPVPPENLHITLVFIGAADDDDLGCIERAAARVRGVPFELVLDRLGYLRRPRILWLGPSRTPAALQSLVAGLRGALAGCGFAQDERPFLPHMTLARKVGRRPTGLAVEPVAWAVSRFTLLESVPHPGGVRYRALASWPLDERCRG